MAIQVEVISPTGTLAKGVASEIIAPSTNGEVGVLPEHTNYVTSLEKGPLSIQLENGKKEFNITGGLMTVSNDVVTILVEGLQEEAA